MVMQINSTGGVDAQLGCLHHTHSGGITRNGGIVVVLRGKGCRVSARWDIGVFGYRLDKVSKTVAIQL